MPIPVEQIGRYTLPLGCIQATKIRNTSGWRRLLFWIRPGFDAILDNGKTIHLTPEEKASYDTAMDWNAVTLEWYGAMRGMGLRG
jgi:hypothetical protein